MKFRFLLLILLAALPLTHTRAAEESSSTADALKERIIAHARTVTPEAYAYTRTVKTEGTDANNKKEESVLVDRWDPSKPVDQRWTLVTIDGKPPTADQLKMFRKALPKRRVAYYGRVAGYFDKPATKTVDASGRTVFRFAALPKESVMVGDADISANATGEVVVDTTGATPFIEEARFTCAKPTRVKLIAKIEHFETMTRYRLMPDGKPVPIEAVSDMAGSMLGQEGRMHVRIVYSDHRAIGK